MKDPSFLVRVEVKPGSKNPGLSITEGAITLRVQERAIEGAANEGCILALAQHFGVPKSRVKLIKGGRSRLKTFQIS